MKFLSIDLEACNMFVKGSVFSVGMVLADEKFNVIYKRNYLINPLCRFAINFRKPIDFKINRDDLKDKPTFAAVRDELAAILEDKDTIVMAHSANNDMFMLNEGCRRAGVKPFCFDYICTQLIHSAIYNVENSIGLDKVADGLGLSFSHHQADDDAEIALYLLKHCIEKLECNDYYELERKLGIKRGHIQNYSLSSMQCEQLKKLREERKNLAVLHQKQWQKDVRQGKGIVMHLDSKQFDLIKCHVKTIEVRLNDDKRRNIKPGDVIYFVRSSSKSQIIKTTVNAVNVYPSFDEAYLNNSPEHLGFRDGGLIDYLENMYGYYSETAEDYYGVVALHIAVASE